MSTLNLSLILANTKCGDISPRGLKSYIPADRITLANKRKVLLAFVCHRHNRGHLVNGMRPIFDLFQPLPFNQTRQAISHDLLMCIDLYLSVPVCTILGLSCLLCSSFSELCTPFTVFSPLVVTSRLMTSPLSCAFIGFQGGGTFRRCRIDGKGLRHSPTKCHFDLSILGPRRTFLTGPSCPFGYNIDSLELELVVRSPAQMVRATRRNLI